MILSLIFLYIITDIIRAELPFPIYSVVHSICWISDDVIAIISPLSINLEPFYSVPSMSFWDVSYTSPRSGTSTPQPQVAGQPSPSLNEEVTEVIGQLGRFWGGFRKQVRHSIITQY
jgi:hypothetical protein